ncbi:MAG: hypothetical protein LBS57_02980 [Treponema sp.]|nr:hypothetical protein [Treponema sp.]
MRKKISPFISFLLFFILRFPAGTQDAVQAPEGEIPENFEEIFGEIPFDENRPGETQPEESPQKRPPVRWFRSNPAGMTLEEIPSRLAALRNEYVLVIDYFEFDELPPLLSPLYNFTYLIECRVLYHNGEESRRQWIFRDGAGLTRLVAVFGESPEAPPAGNTASDMVSDDGSDETSDTASDVKSDEGGAPAEDASAEESASGGSAPTGRAPTGFIEIYNENSLITEERLFSDEGEETVTGYFYRRDTLVRAEARRKTVDEEGGESFVDVYTDNYRYNRSASLRAVERVYHEDAEAVPVRLTFPNRILDAVADDKFIDTGLARVPDFFGDSFVQSGYRLIFSTDERGRILTQTLLDDKNSEVWVIKNTWSGERIVSSLKTEGEDERLTEYEYNQAGDRIVERNSRNGVLERLARAEGRGEVEELYMNGKLILRAVWEDGRKISEERVREK